MIWKQRHSAPRGRTATIEPVTEFSEPPDNAEEPEVMDRLVRVNVKLLLATLVTLIVAAVGIHFVHGYWVQRNASVLLERADVAEQEERYSDAISSLTQYLNLQPQTSLSEAEEQQITDILERLARLFQMQKTTRNQQIRLYRTYEDVLRRDPTRDATRRELVDVCMRLGLSRDAIRHIDTLLDRPKQGEPDSLEDIAELHFLKGDSYWALEEYRAAALAYVHAILTEPSNPRRYTRTAALAVAQPGELPTERQLTGIVGKSARDIAAAFPESTGSDRRRGMQTAINLLDLMLKQAKPSWQAQLLKSEFLLGIRSRDDNLGVAPDVAAGRADALLVERDSNEDGTLDAAEADQESVPVLADANADGLLDRAELINALIRGDRRIRLEVALETAEKAVALADELDDARARVRSLRNAADVNIALANAVQFDQDADPAAYRSAAREYLERGLKTGHASPQIHLSLARLERQQVATGMTSDEIVNHLRRSEQHLRDGLEVAAGMHESDGDDASDTGSEDVGETRPEATEAELLWNLADTLVATYQITGQEEELLAEVRTLIPRLQEVGAREPVIQFLEAQILIAEEQWRSALRLLTPLGTMNLDDTLDKRVAVLRARCLQELEIPDSIVSLFSDRIQRDPLWIQGRIELAKALLASGQVQRAIDEYRRIVTAPGVAESLAQLLLVQQIALPADRRNFAEFETVVDLIPDQASPTRSLLEAELAVLRARTLAEQASQAGDAATRQQLEERSVQMLDSARETLEDAIDTWPDSAEVRSTYAVFLLRRFDMTADARLAAAEAYLQRAVEELGDQVEFRLAASQAAVALPKQAAIASLNELQTGADRFPVQQRNKLFAGLARAYVTAGDIDAAIQLWQKVAANEPKSLDPRLASLQLLLLARQRDDVEITDGEKIWTRTLAEAREIESAIASTDRSDTPKQAGSATPNADYYEAAGLILDAADDDQNQDRDLQKARALLEQARRARPMWSAVPRALGDIEVMRSNRELAVDLYEKAYSLGDRTPTMIGRIAQHYFSQLTSEGVERASQLMNELRAENPNLISGDLAQLQWRISWRQSQFEDALGVLEVLAARSGSLEDRMRWLWGQLLTGREGEDIEQELDALINEFGGESPEAWRLLIAYLSQQGRLEDALARIEEAKQTLPSEPAYLKPLTLASLHELLRTNDETRLEQLRAETERYYRLALDSAPDKTRVAIPMARYYIATQKYEQARPLLEQILAPDSDAPTPARQWARRNQALIVASSGRYDDTTRALQMLSSVSTDSDEAATITDLRARLSILNRRNARSDRDRTIQLLETLQELDRLTDAEHLQLAKLYESTGNWDTADATFKRLISQLRDDQIAVAEYAQAAIRNDKLELARDLTDRLEEIDPGSLLTSTVRARYLVAVGEEAAAVDALNAYVDRARSEVRFEAGTHDQFELRELISDTNEATPQLLAAFDRYVAETAVSNGASVLEKARQLADEGQMEESYLTLVRFLMANDASIAVFVERLKAVATLMEVIGQAEAARPLYDEYVRLSVQPEAQLVQAAYLGRRGEIDAAFAVCEDVWGKAASAKVLGIAVALNRRDGLKPEQLKLVKQWIQQALKEQPRAIPLLVSWADFADSQGDYDTEEKIYRDIIAHSPGGSMIALNNLAYLLALRSGQTEEAMSLIEQAIKQQGPAPVLLETRAVIFLKQGQPDKAISDLTQAVDQNATGTNQFLLAVAMAEAGDLAAADRTYQDALEGGFEPDKLHPLDREMHAQLMKRLDSRTP
ncbi:tetratricopeptide repeat protein [Maioricimonas rarisocia]|uniref:Tetratricopeptide repeat protein n=1 Tax=Maioricimonas rarisocia TaxID=2528026 RepID=A0A517Z0Q8_9PLAN|nr:tetratricopeptide repeat protein [Maioricimonas rarisocia]QDU36066.1 tetratricopeptide repeat protein [Maioricimonas rarisocia]